MKVLKLMIISLLPLWAQPLWAFTELNDQQLDAITAAGHSESSGAVLSRIPFRYSGQHGRVDGEVIVVPQATYNQFGALQISDHAQSNLRSLININAVSSPIQILLNLNINVNSTVGSLQQLNEQLSLQ